ncbi:hypothetical protein acsn021_24610 [Anaerocolumna cellulosilytica]|uniref:Uncharacterized protein n=1 Tax=Anaerocolumna cellulosilytica TaxID=433286 RepID=A0A6S6R616_9FIRM|nr:GNAT family N-acetyltransferase [Anaerocolumna cellulosilytica]MBB5193892.1 RimJ/RimL family protein N-acetyltransferase [Anaerocolumna cellulosilytica]BCJ94892.1 hypothetical protein acsn021_24610 [Anaerocolumna cellulosilytica]
MIELKTEKFSDLIPTLQAVEINTLFAMSVLERKVDGKVWVDNSSSPASFYIQHPYGMALLYGENGKESFYEELKLYMCNSNKNRNRAEWLQVYPPALYAKMDVLLGDCLIKKGPEEQYNETTELEADKILEYQRINFIFRKDKYHAFKRNLPKEHVNIVLMTRDMYNQLNGSVVPRYFWNNSCDFEKYGIGFSLLLKEGIMASTAFASFAIERKLEIGIETGKDYRGSGFAARVCTRLIDYCLENGMEPVWSCSSVNLGSRKLAEKLGFEEIRTIPYYRLPYYV